MHLTKISLKIMPVQWLALYDFLFDINQEVTEQLNSRHANIDLRKYVLFDICQSQTNTAAYHRWHNLQSDKYYTLHLPIGQATALMDYCMNIEYKVNPALYSFIATLYARLTSYVSNEQFNHKKNQNIIYNGHKTLA